MALLVVLYTVIFIIGLSIMIVCTRPPRRAQALGLRLADIRDPRRSESMRSIFALPKIDSAYSIVATASTYLQKRKILSKLTQLLLRTHSTQTATRFIVVSCSTSMAAGLVSLWTFQSGLLTLASILIGLMLPYLFLLRNASQFLKNFDEALPDAISLMARALRAGHSIQQAIELIADQSPRPLCTEFSQVRQEQKFGVPFRDALVDMSLRVQSRDLKFLVTAILVQKETGSDLIEILDRTTRVIRDRVRVAGEIKTYTAQGRLTGWILSLLPVVMLAVISIVSPGYATPLYDTPFGQKLLIGGAVMIAVGSILIRRIVAVEV
ncbi:type II secretion system F family protein [Granulicella arctica]|uniref:type II secretion system F family protein n=1 Tax=Granulicella arctica TaxID=940613 RepID=UPI0021DFA704|nr:type II secretion system F family protein [Granulicella arctica]